MRLSVYQMPLRVDSAFPTDPRLLGTPRRSCFGQAAILRHISHRTYGWNIELIMNTRMVRKFAGLLLAAALVSLGVSACKTSGKSSSGAEHPGGAEHPRTSEHPKHPR